MSSAVHVDSNGKDILIFGEEPTQGLDDTTSTAGVKYRVRLIFLKSCHENLSFHNLSDQRRKNISV